MYEQKPIDLNMMDQAWFERLEFPDNLFMLWLTFQLRNSLGIWEINMHKFFKFTNGLIDAKEFDVVAFAEKINQDKQDRIILLDRGKKLWFTPTLIFRGCDTKTGIRKFTTSDRDIALFRELSARPETRAWFEEQAIYNDRLDFNRDVLNKAYNHKEASKETRAFARRLAKKMGTTILAGKNHPDDIKDRYGCACQYCGETFARLDLEIEHVIRKSNNHKNVDEWWNKVPACKKCNAEKGTKHPLEFIQEKGFELQIGVEKALNKWEKLGEFNWGSGYPIKRNKKESSEKLYTYNWILTNYTFSDQRPMNSLFEITDHEGKDGKKLWRKLK